MGPKKLTKEEKEARCCRLPHCLPLARTSRATALPPHRRQCFCVRMRARAPTRPCDATQALRKAAEEEAARLEAGASATPARGARSRSETTRAATRRVPPATPLRDACRTPGR